MTVRPIPKKVVEASDWAAVCDALIESPVPLEYAMTESETRVLYQFMYRRGYRISIRSVPGGYAIIKGAQIVKPKAKSGKPE